MWISIFSAGCDVCFCEIALNVFKLLGICVWIGTHIWKSPTLRADNCACYYMYFSCVDHVTHTVCSIVYTRTPGERLIIYCGKIHHRTALSVFFCSPDSSFALTYYTCKSVSWCFHTHIHMTINCIGKKNVFPPMV